MPGPRTDPLATRRREGLDTAGRTSVHWVGWSRPVTGYGAVDVNGPAPTCPTMSTVGASSGRPPARESFVY